MRRLVAIMRRFVTGVDCKVFITNYRSIFSLVTSLLGRNA